MADLRPGLYIRLDGPPGPDSGLFVEIEDERGFGQGKDNTGADWVKQGDDYWLLGPLPKPIRKASDDYARLIVIVADIVEHMERRYSERLIAQTVIDRVLDFIRTGS